MSRMIPGTGSSFATERNIHLQIRSSSSSRSSSYDHVQVGRHEHPLVQLSLPNLFTCTGCKEFGAGRRFSCRSCNFELHDFCATAPPQLKLHPLHPQHQLLLHVPKPSGGGGILKSKCDICGKPTKGYTFCCSASGCSFQLHPCCTMLSTIMEFPIHPHHSLILLPSDAVTGRSSSCCVCKQTKRSGQVYKCTLADCDYLLHAVCAKSMVNGLHAHGIKVVDDKKDRSNMLGAAARIASHVVIGFIGGLIEGIGEGVGEAFTQNIVNKGRRTTKSTRRPIASPVP